MALRPFTLYCASSTLRIRSWCVRMSSATPFRAMKLSMRLTLQHVRKSQRVGFTYSFQSLSLTSRARITFEENFKEIFGQCGYVFFSIVKLFEGVFKTAQACVSDGFTSELVRLYDTEKECEEIYLA